MTYNVFGGTLNPALSIYLSIYLGVCLSVTRWYCVETAQPIVKLSEVTAW